MIFLKSASHCLQQGAALQVNSATGTCALMCHNLYIWRYGDYGAVAAAEVWHLCSLDGRCNIYIVISQKIL
jgi:hypothetical protein